MSKFELNVPLEIMSEMKFDWNGFCFRSLKKYCIENKVFPEVLNIRELQQYMSDYLSMSGYFSKEEDEDTLIKKSTFYNWQQDNEKGPKDSSMIALFNNLFSEYHFLHIPFDVEQKDILYKLYVIFWQFHYDMPLAMEFDTILHIFIENIKKTYFHEDDYKDSKKKDQLTGDALNDFMKKRSPNLYGCKLLDSFYEEYHQILKQNNVTQFHVIIFRGELQLVEEKDDDFYFLDWNKFTNEYKEILRQRQECLEVFGDNLRTIFLGTDILGGKY